MSTVTAAELERSLFADHLDHWFPRCVDARGGFHQGFDRGWNALPGDERFLVHQARQIWVCATIGEAYGGEWLGWADHGFRFLTERMQRAEGAYLWRTDIAGNAIGRHSDEIHSYGMAFAIYALAALARATGRGLAEAQAAFTWLERHALDREHGGYWECTDLEGNVLRQKPPAHPKDRDGIGTPYGLKSQNTHLHLVEAFAELYRVWPDPLLGQRLRELLRVMRERIYSLPGGMILYVHADLSPASPYISYGHDVEAMHLLHDAATLVGEEVEVRSLVDHALERGWDGERGGFYNVGYPGGETTDRTKTWWVQAEGLVALALMDRLHGDETPRYRDALAKLWAWCREHQIDAKYGGWIENLAPDGTPQGPGWKGHTWKAAYHDGRALLFTARLLRNADRTRATS